MTSETGSRALPGTFLDLLDSGDWDRLRAEMRKQESAPGETIVAA